MYSSTSIALKFLKYYLTAKNSKGHGIHSPFVYEFVREVLMDNTDPPRTEEIEKLRGSLKKDKSEILLRDYGAKGNDAPTRKSNVSKIAKISLKSSKYAKLLARLVRFYNCHHLVELGTSLGITSSYLASANANAYLTTFEGDENIAAAAKRNFRALNLSNVTVVTGPIDETLTNYFDTTDQIDLLFIDANHRLVPTLDYFEMALTRMRNSSIMIFDDIHWSAEMEEAWRLIKAHSSVRLSIDLFFIGIIFFNEDVKVPQHFVIRF